MFTMPSQPPAVVNFVPEKRPDNLFVCAEVMTDEATLMSKIETEAANQGFKIIGRSEAEQMLSNVEKENPIENPLNLAIIAADAGKNINSIERFYAVNERLVIIYYTEGNEKIASIVNLNYIWNGTQKEVVLLASTQVSRCPVDGIQRIFMRNSQYSQNETREKLITDSFTKSSRIPLVSELGKQSLSSKNFWAQKLENLRK